MTNRRQRIRKVADTKRYPSTLIQKSIVFKLFHSGKRFQKVPFSWIFLCGYKRISVDRRRIRNNKVAFSNLAGIVWTGPNCPDCLLGLSSACCGCGDQCKSDSHDRTGRICVLTLVCWLPFQSLLCCRRCQLFLTSLQLVLKRASPAQIDLWNCA